VEERDEKIVEEYADYDETQSQQESEIIEAPPAQVSSSDPKEIKAAAKRDAFRRKKLAAYEVQVRKMFAEIDKAEAREKAATQDPTKQREVELFAVKKRDELTKAAEQQRRVIMTSTASKISYERRKALYGYGFIAIWAIGVLFIFAGPLIESLIFSLSDTAFIMETVGWENADGSQGTRDLVRGVRTFLTDSEAWNNFGNYRFAFVGDAEYGVELAATLGRMLPEVFMILVFSLFVAILLNQKFKGRTLMRAIFFFPVLIATGPVLMVINNDIATQGVGGGGAQFSTMFRTDMVDELLLFLGIQNLSENFMTLIGDVMSDIFGLLWRSGIQILIFLSALQQIPTSAKEAASMEGATSWEFFWKITFPTISPMILANMIYTIIDTFSDAKNEVMARILMYGSRMGIEFYGTAAAMAWIYFGIIAIALVIVVAIVSRFVFYQVD